MSTNQHTHTPCEYVRAHSGGTLHQRQPYMGYHTWPVMTLSAGVASGLVGDPEAPEVPVPSLWSPHSGTRQKPITFLNVLSSRT